MGKRNNRNNNRTEKRNADTSALKIYNLIMDNDEIRDICNQFTDDDDLFDFVDESWSDEGDLDTDLIKDILDDNTMLRGFSPRKFLPAMKEWLGEEFVYHNGELGLIIQDIAILTSKATNETLEAYDCVAVICANIMDTYGMEAEYGTKGNRDATIIALIHAIRACLNYIKEIGEKHSYTAASSSTKEPEKETEEEVEEAKLDKEVVVETQINDDTSNASTVDSEELKDKVDVESIAQSIYSEIKDSGKMEELIMNSIIEGVRQVVDAGKMSDDVDQKISESFKNANDSSTNIGDVIKDVVNTIIPTIVGDDSQYDGVINRLRNKQPIIDVEEDELREVEPGTTAIVTTPVTQQNESNKTEHENTNDTTDVSNENDEYAKIRDDMMSWVDFMKNRPKRRSLFG